MGPSVGASSDQTGQQRPVIPWWQLATVLLLGVAFVLALSDGREIEAAIVAVLALPYVIFVAASLLIGPRRS